MLQTVQPLVLQRRVEQRREMAPPHDGREQDPCNHGEREEPDDAGMEEREDPAAPRLRGGGAQEERDRPRVQQERRRHQREQHVLDHVIGEQGGVVALHPGIQRHQDRQQAQHPRDRPAPRNRVCGVSPVDPPHAGAPQDRSDDHGQPDEWDVEWATETEQEMGFRQAVLSDFVESGFQPQNLSLAWMSFKEPKPAPKVEEFVKNGVEKVVFFSAAISADSIHSQYDIPELVHEAQVADDLPILNLGAWNDDPIVIQAIKEKIDPLMK